MFIKAGSPLYSKAGSPMLLKAGSPMFSKVGLPLICQYYKKKILRKSQSSAIKNILSQIVCNKTPYIHDVSKIRAEICAVCMQHFC